MKAERTRRPARRRGPDTGTINVFVTDEQQQTPVDEARWAQFVELVVAAVGIEGEAEVSLLFVDEDHIADLNRRFMDSDGPTDVLSFPIDGIPEPSTSGLMPPGRSPWDPDDQPLLLGDIVVCPAVAARQAPDHAGTYEDEIALLIVHGLLHLIGLDHVTDDDRVAMRSREKELLDQFYGPLGRDPWAS
jgi:probable rRNA maturation factor